MPLYFAYGSCMSLNDLTRTVEKAVFVDTAVVNNYRVGFTRYSENRKGGVADIVKEKGAEMEGVLFNVPDFIDLDIREGAPKYYCRRKIRVFPKKQNRWCWATTYEVVSKSTQEYRPSDEYARIILEGAKYLSPEYRERLRINMIRPELVVKKEGLK